MVAPGSSTEIPFFFARHFRKIATSRLAAPQPAPAPTDSAMPQPSASGSCQSAPQAAPRAIECSGSVSRRVYQGSLGPVFWPSFHS